MALATVMVSLPDATTRIGPSLKEARESLVREGNKLVTQEVISNLQLHSYAHFKL